MTKTLRKLFKEYNNSGDGRIKIWASIRQVMTCTPDLIRGIVELSQSLKTGIHMHLAEHKDEVSFCLQNYQLRPAEFLESLGVLDSNLLTAHNVMLSERELTILKNHEVKLIHCPRNNFDSHGFPKTPRMLEMGLSVGLGSDGAATSSLSLFDEIKVFRSGIHAYWGLPIFDPVVLPARELLKMVSYGGAKAMMIDGAGTIEVGSTADLTIINVSQPHLCPTYNLIKTVVEAAQAADVTDVIVGGRVIMKGREVLTIDEEKVVYESKHRLRAIGQRAGL